MSNAPEPANKAAAIIFMIVMGVGGAWVVGNIMKSANEVTQTPPDSVWEEYKATPRNPSQAIDVSAAALYAAYDANEVRFKQQYEGKTVNMTGTIYTIFDKGIQFDSSTRCYLASDQLSKLVQLTKGQTVTVQGTVEDSLISFRIADCVVLK